MTQTAANDVMAGLISRTIPAFADQIRTQIIPKAGDKNVFEVDVKDGQILLSGDCAGSVATALGYYLKHICAVNQAWNGNREISLDKLVTGFKPIRNVIDQTYRVYMNYCTLAYSMCWWDWPRWEKELDFMALNGINMPLCVIGTEAAWFETLLELGFTEEESLATISAPAFWPWQLMTNIEGYQPVHTRQSVYDRLELGKQILARALEYGMYPVQQGFSGHVPVRLMEKFPTARIQLKPRWCDFSKTAQLDPLDPLFERFGTVYLQKQGALMGNYHYYACDPFHEGAPPKRGLLYLRKVGRAINRLYAQYDPDSVWVMQSWSIRKQIAVSVPKERLLIFDLDGNRCKQTRYFWGRQYVSCHLHNFGGKNSLHGNLQELAQNRYALQKKKGAHVVGSGLMMEGIEQNPIYYDLLFDVNLADHALDLSAWATGYAARRYGAAGSGVQQAMKLLLDSCYSSPKLYEEERGSVVCARPALMPEHGAPNDKIGVIYDNQKLVGAVRALLGDSQSLHTSDGYQFDLCDFTRQALSNLAIARQAQVKTAYEANNREQVAALAKSQLALMGDMDRLLSHRSELCLDRWLFDAQKLARTEQERRDFQRCGKMLLTLWGDVGRMPTLYDYAWREWAGLVGSYYMPRWQQFYDALLTSMEQGQPWDDGKKVFFNRTAVTTTAFGKQLYQWEQDWVNTYQPVENAPTDTDVIPCVIELMNKYFLV